MFSAEIEKQLSSQKKTWLVTGVAGFIGSHIAETLLKFNQKVISIDDFSSGNRRNLEHIKQYTPASYLSNFTFMEGDIACFETCQSIIKNVDVVLHQAAISSVQQSITNPIKVNNSNVTGFLNILTAAKDEQVKRFIYASSSSVYGSPIDKTTSDVDLQSPYAVSKLANDHYANVYHKCYGMETIGLRYFNVFGQRQCPNGPYAAVIPKWIRQLLNHEDLCIYGDGLTTRDFTFIDDIVQANILMGLTSEPAVFGKSFNVASGKSITLRDLYHTLLASIQEQIPDIKSKKPIYKNFRPGDIKRSKANIDDIKSLIDYQPTGSLKTGLKTVIRAHLNAAHE